VDEYDELVAVFYTALRQTILRHPILLVGVVEKPKQTPRWKQLRTIDLSSLVTFVGMSTGETVNDRIIRHAHGEAPDPLGGLPLWRVVVGDHVTRVPARRRCTCAHASQCVHASRMDRILEVGFFYHHAMADGMSGTAFHLDFLNALEEVVRGVHAIPEDLYLLNVPTKALLPPIDDTYWPKSTRFLLSNAIDHYIRSSRNPRTQFLGPPVTYDLRHPPKTQLRLFFLNETRAAMLSWKCHRAKTTITVFLTALIARQLAMVYPEYDYFPASLAISVRPFTEISNRQMGDHAAAISIPSPHRDALCAHEHVELVESEHGQSRKPSFCDILPHYQAHFKRAKQQKNQVLSLLPLIGNLEQYFKTKKRDCSFELSNIGVVDGKLPEHNPPFEGPQIARMRKFVFSQSATVTGEPYCFCVGTVKGSEMAVTLTWQDGIVEESKAEEVMSRLEKELKELI
jgi:hypothetical protein